MQRKNCPLPMARSLHFASLASRIRMGHFANAKHLTSVTETQMEKPKRSDHAIPAMDEVE